MACSCCKVSGWPGAMAKDRGEETIRGASMMLGRGARCWFITRVGWGLGPWVLPRVRPVACWGRSASCTPWICPKDPWIRMGLCPMPAMYWFSRKVPCGPAGKTPVGPPGPPMRRGLPVGCPSPIVAPRCTAAICGC